MGYCLNRLDEPVFIELSKPLLTEFGIHYRLESCGGRFETEIVALYLPVLHFSANFLIGVVDVIAGELRVRVNPCPVQEVGSVSVDVLDSQTKRLLQRPIRRRVFQNTT